jgi:hypothetical protein
MGALERNRISEAGVDKRAHSPDRTRAGPACTDFGTDRLASPDDGIDLLACPDDGIDLLAFPDDGIDLLAFPAGGTDWLARPDDGIDQLASHQLGLITRAQLRRLGLTRSAIHVRVRARRCTSCIAECIASARCQSPTLANWPHCSPAATVRP